MWSYRDRMLDLKNDKRFRYVLIFKNHGEAAGATVEHTHSQLIALPIDSAQSAEEVDNCWHYYDEKERCILRHYPAGAGNRRTRNWREDHFITLSPYAHDFVRDVAASKAHGSSFENNQSSMYASLARIMKDTMMRLDAVLDRQRTTS